MARGYATRSKLLPPGRRPGREDSNTKSSSPASAAAATLLNQDVEIKANRLLCSIDYGTKTLSFAYRFAKPNESPSPTNVHDIHFSERDYFAPQTCAWAEDGTFIWGYNVEEALSSNLIEQEDVIELWKLVLYKDYQSSELAKRVEAQLGDRTLDELISTHLREVISEAKNYIKRSQTLEYSAEDIDNLPMELFLSVPQMWKAPANLVMTKAAKEAGVDYIELVYEPQCAAAYYTHNIKDRVPKQLVVGDILLIADVGGGTGDFVSYEYRQDSDVGAKVGIRMSGKAQGSLCGSEFVNLHFIDWLKKKSGNFNTKCKDLGLSPMACIKQASAAFESIKQSFKMVAGGTAFVTIRGVQGAKSKMWDIELKNEEIAGFFEPVIRDIIDCIEAQIVRGRTKVLIIPGGFGRSVYLLKKLREKYEPDITILGQANAAVGAYQPVSRGALLRYKDIQVRGIPAKEAFGIAQVEIYDADVHADATFYTGDELPNGRICRKGPIMNSSIVEIDPFDEEKIVYERWHPIMVKGVIKVPGETFQTETWQQKMVRVGEQQIAVQVYWTENRIKPHDPIREGKDGKSPLRVGIEPWGDELVMDLPNLSELGFATVKSATKGLVYEIYYRLVMKCDGANISVKWQIAKPGTQPYDENGEQRDSEVQLTEDEVYELCAASHNPFPRVTPN